MLPPTNKQGFSTNVHGRRGASSVTTGSQSSSGGMRKGMVIVGERAPPTSSLRVKASNDETSEFLASMRATGGVGQVMSEGAMELSPRSSMRARQRAQKASHRLPMFGDAQGV